MSVLQQGLNDQAVVIGGGPAGAAAAITLARAGRQVCLFERKPGPHNKVCGEFISWEAAGYLEGLGVDLAALGARPVRRVCLYSGEDRLAARLPVTAWSLSRRALDAALLHKAQLAGVQLHLGATVRDLSRTDTGWQLSVLDRNSANPRSLVASTVFLASGKHDLRHWRRSAAPAEGGCIGLKMHLRLTPAQQEQLHETVEVYLFDGGYAGLEMVEEGQANLCFLINKNIYSECGRDWRRVFNWLGETSLYLQARLAGSEPLWEEPLAVSGVPYGYIHSPSAAVPGLFRLGDQTAVIPSLAGDGIAIALHSGLLAAGIFNAGGDSGLYQQQACKDFERPVRYARFIARLFSRPLGRRAAFSLSRLMPQLVTKAISHTRTESL